MKPTLRQIEEREKQKKEKRQIDTLIKYDRAKICPKCGELMRYAFGEVFKCDNCGAEEMTSFGKVRKYIEDHGPSNAANISDGTGVPAYGMVGEIPAEDIKPRNRGIPSGTGAADC